MKFNSATAAAFLLLGDLSSVFGEGDGPIKLQKREIVERDLLSIETERDLGSREQEDLWRHILRDSQISFQRPQQAEPTPVPTNSPTPRPTNRPTPRPTPRPTNRPTRRPTNRPTNTPTLPPDEECGLEVSKLIISSTCH